MGLKQIAQDGVSVIAVLSIVAGVVIGVLFVRRQLALEDPLIDMRLFRTPAFAASLATYGVTILVMFGGFFYLPQYLQLILGLSPFKAGLWMLPWTMAFIVGSLVTPKLARLVRPGTSDGWRPAALDRRVRNGRRRWGRRRDFAYFALATFIFSLGVSPVFTLTTDLIIGSAPPERAGAASAISETSGEFGGALGIALFGSIGVAVYRTMVADVVPPGLSPEVVEATKATLGGAMATAAQLPPSSALRSLTRRASRSCVACECAR